MTALLLHGPTALEALLDEPRQRGWLTPYPPFGFDKGLKVDDARELVAAVATPPPSDRLCAYMASLQGTTDRVQDVLLKVLEDHDTKRVTILLAVDDIGNVLPTVRSRCHERWCGGEIPSPALLGTAQGILSDLKAGRLAEALDPLRRKSCEAPALLDALTVASKGDPVMWAKLRPLYAYSNLSLTDLLGVLL